MRPIALFLLLCITACSSDPATVKKEKEMAADLARLTQMEAEVVAYEKKIQEAKSDHGLVLKLISEQEFLKSRIARLKTRIPAGKLSSGPAAGGH